MSRGETGNVERLATVLDSQISSINNMIYLRARFESGFGVFSHDRFSLFILLVCVLDCCDSLLGTRPFCQG